MTAIILIENHKPSNNLGPLIRCCNAFGVSLFVLIGHKKCSSEGSHGATKNVAFETCPSATAAVRFLRKDCQCTKLVGIMGCYPDAYDPHGVPVRIQDGEGMQLLQVDISSKLSSAVAKTRGDNDILVGRCSFPVSSSSFAPGNICFVVSKDRQGLPLKLAEHCDSFVHVPHLAMPGVVTQPALLDYQTCVAIVLHHFSRRAGYNEQLFQGHKFSVQRPALETESHQRTVREQYRLHLQHEADALHEDTALAMLFPDDSADC